MNTARRPVCMTLLPALAIATTSLYAAPLGAAEVYKTVDVEGHVVYTDHADPNAPQTAVLVNPQSSKHAATTAKRQGASKAADQQRKKQQTLAAAKLARINHDAQMQCDAAQKTFYAMKATGATDATTAIKREQARQSMVLACTD
jgi:hypothetical protein